ncbi:hypothetical protein [Ramlibacter albus]|uniref:Uncharacterized protein n=1 Tax=Ramlibacter albus TaxID=2079448 RepID=A0A923M502_9BURK|nr:hypothetical protein [Ramlibacter albus]MBC5764013.1 hypothetical protein [Ramlibacter albus]
MPIRTASMSKRIARNGQALHRAMMSRGASQQPTEEEQALIDERKQLKEEREKRKAQALLPRPSALDRLVRTHHPTAKDKPKADKKHDEVKKPKARRSRAEKHAEQAAAIEAARKPKGAKPAAKAATK